MHKSLSAVSHLGNPYCGVVWIHKRPNPITVIVADQPTHLLRILTDIDISFSHCKDKSRECASKIRSVFPINNVISGNENEPGEKDL